MWQCAFDGFDSPCCCAESSLSAVSNRNKLLTGIIVSSRSEGLSVLTDPHIDIIGAVDLGRVWWEFPLHFHVKLSILKHSVFIGAVIGRSSSQ